ncbi:hypothetical protein [Glaciihabitans sp. dw_435]|uniref:hypothetical protein n=1 Tax=Glaciihabitans sp. dw_435 TaxID=2720081 RepID=UPI001BD3EDB7|nr:hypothetical protein [Glaciihabitans sp. dw_435]
MRVLLKMVLDCDPDDAWRAIRSPAVLTAVSAPLTVFTSLEPGGFPELWPAGVHPVRVQAAGLVTIGVQTIDIAYPERSDDVRMMRDSGRGLTGPLALITRWQHTMAIAPAPGGRTLYRDQLVFEAGRMTLLLFPLYWSFWQWRAFGIRRLAPGWRAK